MLEFEIFTLFVLIGVIISGIGVIYSLIHPLKFKSKRMVIAWIGVVILLLGGIGFM
jgi:glucose uptake protein GlcU